MKKKNLLIVCLCFASLSAFSQKMTGHYDVNEKQDSIIDSRVTTIPIEKKTKTTDYIIMVRKNTEKLDIQVTSKIEMGKIIVEIYNPKGEKLKKDIELDTEHKSEYKTSSLFSKYAEAKEIKGDIVISVKDAEPGDWKVKIIPTNALGNVIVKSNTISLKIAK